MSTLQSTNTGEKIESPVLLPERDLKYYSKEVYTPKKLKNFNCDNSTMKQLKIIGK